LIANSYHPQFNNSLKGRLKIRVLRIERVNETLGLRRNFRDSGTRKACGDRLKVAAIPSPRIRPFVLRDPADGAPVDRCLRDKICRLLCASRERVGIQPWWRR
jgi:hypothetical protein